MTAADADKPSFFRKYRGWLRLACWTLFLLWFTRYAYVRITTPTAARAGARPSDSGATDEFDEELARLFANLAPPAPAPASASAPSTRIGAWSWWTPAALSGGLIGEWNPNADASQRAAVQYVTGPAGDQLDRMVKLIDERRAAGEPLPAKPPGPSMLTLVSGPGDCGTAVSALVFRARYLAAEQSDLAAALRDLRTAFVLAVREQSAEVYSLPQYELGRLTLENTIPPEQAAGMIAFLRDELSLSITAALERVLRASHDVDRLLDKYYTRDDHGDGWLVLSAASDLPVTMFVTRSGEHSRVWNVFAPLFHDRATMRRRLTGFAERLAELDNASYRDACERGEASGAAVSRLNMLDGPLAPFTGGVRRDAIDHAYWLVAHRRAAVVMLALAAYRHETGEYPKSLDALVPRFIDKLPLDAGANAPFVYERGPDSSYELKTPDASWLEDMTYYWWMPAELYPDRGYMPARKVSTR